MRFVRFLSLCVVSSLLVVLSQAVAQRSGAEVLSGPVPSRVLDRVDDSQRVRLVGNTHPLARAKFDQGLVDPKMRMEKMILVLKRSDAQERALAAFNERQYDTKSADFHHWLTASEFGQMYGPSDADISAVSNWLQNHGFTINEVAKGRTWLQFSGSAAQVQEAFHVEMHNYLVNGEKHIANDRDPQIPKALAPVVGGVASLHDFFAKSQLGRGRYVTRNTKTGKVMLMDTEQETPRASSARDPLNPVSRDAGNPSAIARPDFTYKDTYGYTREDLTAYDLAIIYNVLPLWQASTPINGTGVTVAVVADSDVVLEDIANYRTVSHLPTNTVNVIQTDASTDPGTGKNNSADAEAEVDLEMVSASAPGATLDLVVSADTATTGGDQIAAAYIIDNEVAPILTSSYGECELQLGTSGNMAFNQLWQQGATEGISIFVSAGDQGSAGCDNQSTAGPNLDTIGVQVNGIASSPYVTAVGGTDLAWYYDQGTTPLSTYWNSTNDANNATAKGYMPEIAWNTTCSNPLLLNIFTDGQTGQPFPNSEAFCNRVYTNTSAGLDGIVKISAGSGGASLCTVNNTTNPDSVDVASCSGGYAKPTWQTALTPADGHRDVPDIAMFASYGYGFDFPDGGDIPSSAILFCIGSASPNGTCQYSSAEEIGYQENGGTSAATPYSAGVMAMVLQANKGVKQGLANPVFYKMAAAQSTTECNSATVAAGNSCYFHDIAEGSNAQVCDPTKGNYCTAINSGDSLGILGTEVDGSYVNLYNAGVGYDKTTGVGSMNVANLVNGWAAASGAPAITLSPTTLTFASTTVGATSAAQTVTVKNTGTTAATLTSETLTGANASSYVVSTKSCGSTLAAAATCTVSIEFQPTAAGALGASLSVADNAAGSPQTVAISGTGASAATLTLSVSPATLTFASTAVGSTSAAQAITVKNTGTAAVTLSSETLTGSNAGSYLISANTCTSALAAGASCAVSVEFKPTASGSLAASLSVVDNATGSPQTVALTGTGAAAALTGTLSPASLTFASTVVGASSAAQVITFKNTGTSAITVSSYKFSGTDASSFVLSAKTCGTTLAAGASCTLSVAFKPVAVGTLTASLLATDNAAGSPQMVALSGTGTSASTLTLALSPSALTFSSTTVGSTSAAQVVTVKNTGTAAVTLTSETLTGTNAAAFQISAKTCTTSLAAGTSCTVSVAFKPTASGSQTASLSVADNATGSPQTVGLTGTGSASAAATVSLSPASIAFPATVTGATSDAQVVTLTNTGTASVTLSGIALSGTNITSFVDLTNCGSTLAGGASCSIYVAFKPSSAAAKTATLSVTDTATGSPQKVTLSGTGTAAPSVKVSSASIAFPTTAAGGTSGAQAVTLTNAGTSTLTLTSIALAGTSPADFEELNTCVATLAPAASCTVYVAFKPAAAASYTATLVVTDNGSTSSQSVALSGTGN